MDHLGTITDNHRQELNKIFNDMLESYKGYPQPIPVNFRKLVNFEKYPERYTHLIHPYPAKLLAHIPYFFLSCTALSKPGDIVLDPFCGSGTVLLETILSGRIPVGADSNPLARIISQAKITPLPSEKLTKELDFILSEAQRKKTSKCPNVINIEYWYKKKHINQLSCLLSSIKKVTHRETRSFFLVCLSVCARKVSLADPRLSVPVRLNPSKYPEDHPTFHKTSSLMKKVIDTNVYETYKHICQKNILRLSSLNKKHHCHWDNYKILTDARTLSIGQGEPNKTTPDSLLQNSVDLVITSPPYNSAQKYIRASSLGLGWLEFGDPDHLLYLNRLSIGTEKYRKTEYQDFEKTGIVPADLLLEEIHQKNPLRAHIAGQYLIEMRTAFRSISKTVKNGGYLVLVAGNNTVTGRTFETPRYLSEILTSEGFSLKLELIDEIQSRGLMTKRNKTADIINCETINIFRKG